ncbi:MAG: AMP-binding protein, partial [Gammaproteobacteria bacterium]|nr:AMP-binding protein [Gammaproteobacteria bacterium]
MTEITTYSLPELLLRGAAAHPDRDCIVLVDERATYGELEARARRAARSLVALGVERGDRVGILMANCLDFVDMLFGTSMIGAVAVLYNARFKAREIAHVTKDAGVKVIITNDIVEQHTNYVELLHRALPGLAEHDPHATLSIDSAPDLRTAATLGSSGAAGFVDRQAFYELGDSCPTELVDERLAQIDCEDAAVMIYTSGTTAMPKGCPLTHVVLQHAGVVGGAERVGLVEGDVMWGPLPMFHTAFTQPLTGILHVGGTYLSMTHFEPGQALAMIQREGATAMFPAFPTITMQLLNHPSYTADSFASIRIAINVGP